MEQVVWAVDIDFGLSDIAALRSLVVQLACAEDKGDDRLTTPTGEERYAVVSTRLRHTNLTLIQFNVFLQMCRAHLIAYDNKVQYVHVFNLLFNP